MPRGGVGLHPWAFIYRFRHTPDSHTRVPFSPGIAEIMRIEVIKTIGLRGLGILFVLAGGALLVPSLGAMTEKRSKAREQAATHYERLAACLRTGARSDDCRRAAQMQPRTN